MTDTLLVTGASGHLGQRVIELLLASGHQQIIATTRTPEKLAHFGEQGVTVRRADFEDVETLPDALAGADRMLLISTDALDRPGRRLQQHKNAVQAAETAGVKHVLYTSIPNPTPDSPIFVVPDHLGTEQALEQSGLSWTFLRNNLYTSYVLGGIKPALESGFLVSATGDGKAAFVTREDCAQVAAAALASSTTENQKLDVTGPEAISYADLAAVISDVFGKPITFKPVTVEQKVAGMVQAGLPEPLARGLSTFDLGISQGRLANVSSVVQDLTGQTPMSVREFLIASRE